MQLNKNNNKTKQKNKKKNGGEDINKHYSKEDTQMAKEKKT